MIALIQAICVPHIICSHKDIIMVVKSLFLGNASTKNSKFTTLLWNIHYFEIMEIDFKNLKSGTIQPALKLKELKTFAKVSDQPQDLLLLTVNQNKLCLLVNMATLTVNVINRSSIYCTA